MFTAAPGLAVAQQQYAEQKQAVADAGRDPKEVRLLPMAYTVVGETEAIAREKERLFLDEYVHPLASLALLSEVNNYDFSVHDLDDPVTEDLAVELLSDEEAHRAEFRGFRREYKD